ncbi:hypothetical protein JTE90_029274 [Oedothorax gibbosus]|uniref:Uncharacterized protein n=1 Tax=Oedothorax gibbosus TaxID=931172 RepID=A0AAV6TNQ8_9ARAC|nr:hypothetical protein JTE90_029274 [Oedothorax gibbosus]
MVCAGGMPLAMDNFKELFFVIQEDSTKFDGGVIRARIYARARPVRKADSYAFPVAGFCTLPEIQFW